MYVYMIMIGYWVVKAARLIGDPGVYKLVHTILQFLHTRYSCRLVVNFSVGTSFNKLFHSYLCTVNTAAAEKLYPVISDWCSVKNNTVLYGEQQIVMLCAVK